MQARHCAITHPPPFKRICPFAGALSGNFGPIRLQDRNHLKVSKSKEVVNAVHQMVTRCVKLLVQVVQGEAATNV